MLRCLVGYFLLGGHVEQDGTFDYPENGDDHSNIDKSTKCQGKSTKWNKVQYKKSPILNHDSDFEDDAKMSKDFSGKTA